MALSYPDTLIRPIATTLLACLCDAVAANPDPPAICGYRTGTAGFPLAGTQADECCNGAAFLRVLPVYPSNSVPTPKPTAVRCSMPLGVQFELSMWRCVQIGTAQTPPTQADWDSAHSKLLDDRVSLMNAICCFLGQRDPESVVVGPWQAVEVEGGCVGSTIAIDVDAYWS